MRKTARPKEVVSFLEKNGFIFICQRGSHAIYEHNDGRFTIVPMHNRELPKGTFHTIFKDAKLDKNLF